MADNYFAALNAINVNGKTEKKNGLTYLSWAWAWGEVKKLHPDATYTVYENADGLNYHHDGKTAWVKTGVTVNGIEHIEYLPVMDHRNKSIGLAAITSFDVNKTIQRSLTKACARHGLGLYIYAGEDLPESDEPEPAPKPEPITTPKMATPEQIRIITSYASPDVCEAMMNKYGTDLERQIFYHRGEDISDQRSHSQSGGYQPDHIQFNLHGVLLCVRAVSGPRSRFSCIPCAESCWQRKRPSLRRPCRRFPDRPCPPGCGWPPLGWGAGIPPPHRPRRA